MIEMTIKRMEDGRVRAYAKLEGRTDVLAEELGAGIASVVWQMAMDCGDARAERRILGEVICHALWREMVAEEDAADGE